ncbi:FtsX-like permease family protein [Planctomycetes bacterium Pan216]|uniref:FtsX-like permease family protein n=1 Tax=Kolteria novifilia TaxID=2527975 RepID=A0A518B073_9BACT|nr:FtsX-like permease family protein [Planctomycetes bacterium Pan216]
MKTPLAWRKICHQKTHTLVVIAAIGFTITLIFMQCIVFNVCRVSGTVFYDLFDFDLLVISSDYDGLVDPGQFSHQLLQSIKREPEVIATTPIRAVNINWRNPSNGQEYPVQLVGVDLSDPVFRSDHLKTLKSYLSRPMTVMIDRRSLPAIGKWHINDTCRLGASQLDIAAAYSHGIGFSAFGCVVCGSQTFLNVVPYDGSKTTFGLVRLAGDTNRDALIERLRESLPDDVAVVTPEEISVSQQYRWIVQKPVGILLGSGVIISVLVASIILHQILSHDVNNHLHEYATLKAIGYYDSKVKSVLFIQASLWTLLSFLPATLVAWILCRYLNAHTPVPVLLAPGLLVIVLAITATICLVCGTMVLAKLKRADPVDLF